MSDSRGGGPTGVAVQKQRRQLGKTSTQSINLNEKFYQPLENIFKTLKSDTNNNTKLFQADFLVFIETLDKINRLIKELEETNGKSQNLEGKLQKLKSEFETYISNNLDKKINHFIQTILSGSTSVNLQDTINAFKTSMRPILYQLRTSLYINNIFTKYNQEKQRLETELSNQLSRSVPTNNKLITNIFGELSTIGRNLSTNTELRKDIFDKYNKIYKRLMNIQNHLIPLKESPKKVKILNEIEGLLELIYDYRAKYYTQIYNNIADVIDGITEKIENYMAIYYTKKNVDIKAKIEEYIKLYNDIQPLTNVINQSMSKYNNNNIFNNTKRNFNEIIVEQTTIRNTNLKNIKLFGNNIKAHIKSINNTNKEELKKSYANLVECFKDFEQKIGEIKQIHIKLSKLSQTNIKNNVNKIIENFNTNYLSQLNKLQSNITKMLKNIKSVKDMEITFSRLNNINLAAQPTNKSSSSSGGASSLGGASR